MSTGPVQSNSRQLSSQYDATQPAGEVQIGPPNGAGLLGSMAAESVVSATPAKWFALVVKPRFDKAVARTLEAKGFETLVPLYTKQHKHGPRTKDAELPLFPG